MSYMLNALLSKYWRYDTTELLSHASMEVFGGLVNTLTDIVYIDN
jgi:hypothetical protein